MDIDELATKLLSECVSGRTLQIARIVASHYEHALASTGVTPQQMTLLCVVCKRQPGCAREMLPYLKMDQSTLSRNLERMVEKGWLSISQHEGDARVRLYSLSGAGVEALRRASEKWHDAQGWAFNALGKEGVGDIKRIAKQLNPLMPGAVPPRTG